MFPLKFGSENTGTGTIDQLTEVEDIAYHGDYKMLVVTMSSPEAAVVGTVGVSKNAKSVGLFDLATGSWLFVKSFPDQIQNQPMYCYIIHGPKRILSVFSHVDSNNFQYPAIALHEGVSPYSFVDAKYLQVNSGSANMVYNLRKEGVTTNGVGIIWMAINYTLNETTPGANVDGDRRCVVVRIRGISGASILFDSAIYLNVKSDFSKVLQTGAVIKFFKHVNPSQNYKLFLGYHGRHGDSYLTALEPISLAE
jgi:hypothetical protein